ncbi:nuclear transport factor 2 family protein [Muricauda sp. 2012CJ35-5]|uniref:Nuclear transport factor 2 family protein n=1 Tax=Flagellimonas spongiicola TaxID=2942208 RepID=A0ABT0PXZ8_9FLAO|nr:nuclear transport factor 2 family protein [Allomuricauda spongiicola]MCL6275353.1 nuclear transport factor 2 family protein [Allomuricauda spongiicola]
MKFKSLFSLVVVVLLASCADQTKNVQPIVDAYYETYAQRNDFEKLLSYYDESILLEDYINGDKIEGKTALREFLDWDNPNFNMVEPVALTIADQMIEGNKVVTKGHFSKFKWGSYEFGPMQFVTILTFNDDGKIIRHEDWINYPSNLIDYDTRVNSNDWIKK